MVIGTTPGSSLGLGGAGWPSSAPPPNAPWFPALEKPVVSSSFAHGLGIFLNLLRQYRNPLLARASQVQLAPVPLQQPVMHGKFDTAVPEFLPSSHFWTATVRLSFLLVIL